LCEDMLLPDLLPGFQSAPRLDQTAQLAALRLLASVRCQ